MSKWEIKKDGGFYRNGIIQTCPRCQSGCGDHCPLFEVEDIEKGQCVGDITIKCAVLTCSGMRVERILEENKND